MNSEHSWDFIARWEADGNEGARLCHDADCRRHRRHENRLGDPFE
jgi:hypothetical protein